MQSRTPHHHIINNSGTNGINGVSGSVGEDGTDGTSGTNANDIDVVLNADDPNKTVHCYAKDHASKAATLPLGQSDAELNLIAKGGHGGHGGHGGRGENGKPGANGIDATEWQQGTNGSDGTRGGDGGDGGNGGRGGNGGDINITVASEDVDLLMLVNHNNQGGHAGIGGRGGVGGEGGAGGRGGNSHSWSETKTQFDGEGNLTTSIESHFNPGGMNGHKGANGKSGYAGQPGVAGRSGSYHIHVPTQGDYSERYDIKIKRHQSIQSDDGVIEPGEQLTIAGVQIQNVTTMPTPENIAVSLASNEWIGVNSHDVVNLKASVLPGQTAPLSAPLTFHIKANDQFIPAVNSTFRKTVCVPFKAVCPRVNKAFATVGQQHATIVIRYPVEMSTIAHACTFSRQAELPFSLKMRNVSSLPIGSDTKGKRPVFLTFSAFLGAKKQAQHKFKLSLFDAKHNQQHDLSQPVCLSQSLNPSETITFAGALKLDDESLPAYSNIKITVQLSLGSLTRQNQLDIIQQRDVTLQLVDEYRYDPKADFLLVTNRNTTKDTVAAWQKVAKTLGNSLSVWNTSFYSGLSYFQKRHDGGSLIDESKDKVIIILNNEYISQHGNRRRACDYLDQKELFSAAVTANIGTYVIGGSFNIREAATPALKAMDEKEGEQYAAQEEKTVNKKYAKLDKPSNNDLVKKVKKWQYEKRHNDPMARQIMVYDYAPKLIQTGIVDKWMLGEVKSFSALPRDKTHIIHRPIDSCDADNVDVFNALKLLPFAKKLQYFIGCQDKEYHLIIKEAIISDLADELFACARLSSLEGKKADDISQSLSLLNQFQQFNFAFEMTNVTKQSLFEIVMKYYYLAKNSVRKTDLPWSNYRVLLSHVCQKTILEMINHYYPEARVDDEYKQLRRQWKHVDLQKMANNILEMNRQAGVVYDNHIVLPPMLPQHEVKDYQPKTSQFIEGLHFFSGNEERKKSAESYAKHCQFDF